MRKLLLAVMLQLSLFSVAQNIEGMYSFIDYPISNIDIQTETYSYIDTYVRKVDVGDEIQYYYVLKAVSKDNHIGLFSSLMIPYEDLKKINNALKLLLVKEENDWRRRLGMAEIDYVENKYVTECGFGIGYCIDKGRLEWFIESDYYGVINGWNLKERIIDNKAFSINNGNVLEDSFGKAQTKIESLMQLE